MDHVANIDMAKAWDGDEGVHWAEHADRYDASVAAHGLHLQAAAAIAATDQVLDVGCGCGASTRLAARAAADGGALGVDLSSLMLERARRQAAAEGLTNVRFEQADVQVHPFPDAAFDVAISRFGAMFFADPVAAFANVGRALRPGGRLAFLAWRPLADNEWLSVIRTALAAGRELPEPLVGAPGPFGLAAAADVHGILDAAGYLSVTLQVIEEPVRLGADAEDAFGFLRASASPEACSTGWPSRPPRRPSTSSLPSSPPTTPSTESGSAPRPGSSPPGAPDRPGGQDRRRHQTAGGVA